MIAMPLSEIELRRIDVVLSGFLRRRRPEPSIRRNRLGPAEREAGIDGFAWHGDRLPSGRRAL